MSDVTIERRFDAPVETVFAHVTQTELLLQWWGHEGMRITDHQLAFDRKGPWRSTLIGSDGGRYRMSGHVTHVDPPRSIGFTWAWHDENDVRGTESHVTIRLVPSQSGGTDFTLTHVDLPGDDAAASHVRGWTSTLARLERLLET